MIVSYLLLSRTRDSNIICDRLYVIDAFGTCHRAHCSTTGMTQYMKYNVMGFIMNKEVIIFMKCYIWYGCEDTMNCDCGLCES